MSRFRASRRAIAAAVVTVCAVALPASAHAAVINFGSGLGSPASVAMAHPVDTAFWSTALSGGAKARAPQTGQVLSVRIRGCAKRGSGGQVPLTQFHLQTLAPGAGSRSPACSTGRRSRSPTG